jgi:hypothetical protein
VQAVNRIVLPRTTQTISTPWGRLRVKVTRHDGRQEMRPEYDDCRDLAQATGRPLRAVMLEVSAFLRTLTADPPLESPVETPALPEIVQEGIVPWAEPVEDQAPTERLDGAAPPAPGAGQAASPQRKSRHRRRRSHSRRKKTPPA